MSEQVDQKQRTLKIIVILLGVAIMICVGVIGTTMALRAARMGKEAPAETTANEVVSGPQARVLGNVDVPVPYGARVVGVTAGPGELQVLLDLPEGRTLLLVDRRTGEVLGSLRFVPGAVPAAP
ncbi:hypothetical protein [Emcibacter sp. SYSU 3D8]|uniref:hypothetical protein n=1 Tax=Emcibacter sp. SYSU 3D8 TaxID=3133969 RepID=UPI0031FECAE8